MRLWVFLTLIFLLHQGYGQKIVRKAFVPPGTEYIQIDSRFCYQVQLSTAPTAEIEVSASIEGEYAEDLLVSIEESGATILISAGFHPNFTQPNDKLSAHKIISIALKIQVPEYKEVTLLGTTSNVEVAGKYKRLKVKLSDGKCTLDKVEESVEVNTQKGDILLIVPKGHILAKSSYGSVIKDNIPNGNNQYILNTVEGTIRLKKTK